MIVSPAREIWKVPAVREFLLTIGVGTVTVGSLKVAVTMHAKFIVKTRLPVPCSPRSIRRKMSLRRPWG